MYSYNSPEFSTSRERQTNLSRKRRPAMARTITMERERGISARNITYFPLPLNVNHHAILGRIVRNFDGFEESAQETRIE